MDTVYVGSLNSPPVADADGPYTGVEGSPISFDASGSSDPDDDPLQYRWDFDSNGKRDTGWSSDPTATHTWFDDWIGDVTVYAVTKESTSRRHVLPIPHCKGVGGDFQTLLFHTPFATRVISETPLVGK